MKTKRLLALLITMLLMVGLLPLSTFAVENVPGGESKEETAIGETDGSAAASGMKEVPARDENKEPEADGKGDKSAEEKEDDASEEDKEESPAFSQNRTVSGVTVSVAAGAGVFPKDAALSVADISSQATEAAVAPKRGDDANVAASYTFDIKVLDKDGNELQPAEGQTSQVSFRTAEVADPNLDVSVYHVSGSTADELAVSEAGSTATAQTTGFSYYTVEFTYGDLQYVLPGGETVALADILSAVGLSGTPTGVQVSKPELFSAYNEGGAWFVESHQPFSTDEWMRVTIGGKVYEIAVTDTQDDVATWTAWGNCEWGIDTEGCLWLRPKNGATTGTLTELSGSGSNRAPWSSQRSSIKSFKIPEGRTVKLPRDSSYLFCELGQMTDCDLSGLDASQATRTDRMFQNCSKLESLDLGDKFDTSNVTNKNGMWMMFYGCSSLKSLDLGDKFDTSKVRAMGHMFRGCSSLESLDLGDKFDTSNVQYALINMFSNCSSLKSLDLGDKFDTSKVTENTGMYGMFYNCSSLESLDLGDKFDTTNIKNMHRMFQGCSSMESLDLGDKFDTSSVTNMFGMFYECSSLTSLDLGDKFDTSNVTDMGCMFYNCSSLTSLDLGDTFDTSKVKNMLRMFQGCSSMETLDLGDKFDTSSVTEDKGMYGMFYECSSLTSLDLGDKFDTSKITNMECMFYNCSSLTSLDLGDKFDTSKVTIMFRMFQGCSSLETLDLGKKFDTSSVTNMFAMFYECSSLTSLDLGDGFDTSNVTDMGCMFYNCSSLTSLDLGGKFDTSSDESMYRMFQGCSSLESLDLGDKFDTSSVTRMQAMFYDCSKLKSLDLGDNFDTSKVSNTKDMECMFYNCLSLTSLDLGDKFDTSNVTDMNQMFNHCSSLESLDLGDKFDTSNVTNMWRMFSDCPKLSSIYLPDCFSFVGNGITDDSKQALLPSPPDDGTYLGKWEVKGNCSRDSDFIATSEELRDNFHTTTAWQNNWWVWQKAPATSTITYILGGGTLDGKTGTVTVQIENGTTITLPKPTREGYTFDYWEGSRYNAGDPYKVDGDHTFTAKWVKNAEPTPVNPDDNGSGGSGKSGTSGNATPATGDEAPLALLIGLFGLGTLGFFGLRRKEN